MSKGYRYAGIGSRETPENVLADMQYIGEYMADRYWLLRSGAANGADSAFEYGCDSSPTSRKEIFIPWKGFNKRHPTERGVLVPFRTQELEDMAASFHPNWGACTDGAKALHSRNCCQILGISLKVPVDLVICWTPNGSGSGGTGQAIRIARHFGIPVFDLGAGEATYQALTDFVAKLTP